MKTQKYLRKKERNRCAGIMQHIIADRAAPAGGSHRHSPLHSAIGTLGNVKLAGEDMSLLWRNSSVKHMVQHMPLLTAAYKFVSF